MSFVPKVILGGKVADERSHSPKANVERDRIVDINRLSQAFFRIHSIEDRLKILTFIEEVAESQYFEHG